MTTKMGVIDKIDYCHFDTSKFVAYSFLNDLDSMNRENQPLHYILYLVSYATLCLCSNFNNGTSYE